MGRNFTSKEFSILFRDPLTITINKTEPAYFADLNINAITASVVANKESAQLYPFFYSPLHHKADIVYRQDIMRDMENEELFLLIDQFSHQMEEIYKGMAMEEGYYFTYQRERQFLDIVERYCGLIHSFSDGLKRLSPQSDGIIFLCKYIDEYEHSGEFTLLDKEVQRIISALSKVTYSLHVRGLEVEVLPAVGEDNYTARISAVFDRFRFGKVKNYRYNFEDMEEMNSIDESVQKGVATLYPELFEEMENFFKVNRPSFLPDKLLQLSREVRFYLAYLNYIAPMRLNGLHFCYPGIADNDKELQSEAGFDLALADKLISENRTVIPNDFYLNGTERIIIVTGPNQGGKTTFARTFGQLHYLASLGLPVPGKAARLFLFDHLFAHFECEENTLYHFSKLEDDLLRIHDILEKATPDSIIIMNEILSSTTFRDALFLSKKIMGRILRLDALCVWVTFIDELTSLSNKNVSMVSQINPENPSNRTFKVIRGPANGLAHAFSVAEKHGLSYDQLIENIRL